MDNYMKLKFDGISENESFARMSVAAFFSTGNPTIGDIEDIKTAVSEAVTNAIIHGYEKKRGEVSIQCGLKEDLATIVIEDYGKGIEDLEKALEPFYTTKPELERSGMGFTFMEAFMDHMKVETEPGKGTRILLEKRLGCQDG